MNIDRHIRRQNCITRIRMFIMLCIFFRLFYCIYIFSDRNFFYDSILYSNIKIVCCIHLHICQYFSHKCIFLRFYFFIYVIFIYLSNLSLSIYIVYRSYKNYSLFTISSSILLCITQIGRSIKLVDCNSYIYFKH